ncbi:MAG: hypothetical protein FWD57_08670 [Polyangiaceae bacterium]|nr:hypothetical protein [Polyangiaceae bacterium]
MNVMVIPEDSRTDKYILEPIIKAMLTHMGKNPARVRICEDPPMGGYEGATNPAQLSQVVKQYGDVELFVVIVDLDGKPGRRQKFVELEIADGISKSLGANRTLITEGARQEVEVWALAGADDFPKRDWRDVRNHPHPKEAYFIPFVETRRPRLGNGKERAILGKEARKNYAKVSRLCPEVAHLEKRIREYIDTGVRPGEPFDEK